MAASLYPPAESQGQGAAFLPRKRGRKARSMLMKVTYAGSADWDYKRAIYPMMRDWGMFKESHRSSTQNKGISSTLPD